MARILPAPIKVQKYLKGVSYPASKEDLINHAKKNKADNELVSMLEQMKSKKFANPSDVSKALGDLD